MNEWAKLLIPAAFLAIIALLWQIIRPALTRLLFYFLNHEDGRLFFKRYHEHTMTDLHLQVSTTTSAVRTIGDRFEAFEFTQKAHSKQLNDISTKTEEVPRLADSVDRMATSVERFAATVEGLTKWRERVEGREEERNRRNGDPR